MIEISNYKKQYAIAFKELNIAWLEKYFKPEPYDIEVLSNPEKYIIDKGGKIFFVLENGIPIGTVSLMYNQYNELEFTKMAVLENKKGQGYGKLLMDYCIEQAKLMGEEELVLYSNTSLIPAIQLYKNFGFVEVSVNKSNYERCNIKMIKKLC